MRENVPTTRKNLLENYLADKRPWVVAYSGGKDSTLVLQLVYEMALNLKHQNEDALKPIYIIASDTRVEPPNIEEYLAERLEKLTAHANHNELPIHIKLVKPAIGEGFWDCLIGKGYPSPTRWFRWCTHKMKVKPSRIEIEKITAKHGGVILLLGSRLSESSLRKQGMNGRIKNSRGLNPHHEIPNALVFTPIADWETDDVWRFLSKTPPPWGGNHDYMLDLYRQAGGSECLLAIDLQTPSCGGSRFGCWTCTVVKEDKSMKGFLQTGEEWMRPLFDFRVWLKKIREDMTLRLPYRRNKAEGPGPFSPEARKVILRNLLETEQKVGRRLISDGEISCIQGIWRKDFDEVDSAYLIAGKYGRNIKEMSYTEISPDEKELIRKLMVSFEIDETCVWELQEIVSRYYPSLDYGVSGAREELKQGVKRIIEKHIEQENLVEANQ